MCEFIFRNPELDVTATGHAGPMTRRTFRTRVFFIFDMQQPSARPSEDQSVVNTVASPDEDVFAADLAAETVRFQFLTLRMLLPQRVVELHR